MSRFAVDQEVLIPAKVIKVTEDKTGTYIDVEVKAINATKPLSLEEDDVVAVAGTVEEEG